MTTKYDSRHIRFETENDTHWAMLPEYKKLKAPGYIPCDACENKAVFSERHGEPLVMVTHYWCGYHASRIIKVQLRNVSRDALVNADLRILGAIDLQQLAARVTAEQKRRNFARNTGK